MKKNSLKIPMLTFLIVEFLVKIIPFISLPFLTNYWNKSEFGIFSLYIAILPIVSIFIDLGQRTSIKRFYISYPKQTNNFLQIIITSIILNFLLLLSIVLIFNISIIEQLDTIYIIITAFLYTLIEVYMSYLQISRQTISYNIVYFIRQALPYILILILVLTTSDIQVDFFMYIQIFVFIILAIVIYFLIYKNINFTKYKEYMNYSLNISLPVLPAILSAFILSASDKYMISIYYTNEEVALYSIAYVIGSILSMIVLALNKAWQPFILENLKKNNFLTLKKISRYYILFIFVVSIIIIFISKYLILFVSNEEYLVTDKLVPEIIIGMFFYFLYTLYSNIAFFYKKMLLFAIPAIVAALLNIILNIIFLPQYGYQVAATTTMVSYIIEFLIIYVISVKYFKINLI